MTPTMSREYRSRPVRKRRLTERAATTITASIKGISASSATLTPTIGTNHITLTVPNTKPAPKTIAK
jgi:hypothetical protein